MTQLIETAKRDLWEAGEIGEGDVSRLIGRLMHRQVDAGELFFQQRRSESWTLEDGIVKDGAFSVDRGVGVRAVSGEKTGFAYADDIVLPALGRAADAARTIARSGGDGAVQAYRRRDLVPRYAGTDPLQSFTEQDKVALLSRMDVFARGLDPCVKQVTARLAANIETNLVVASDGTFAGDVRPLVRFDVSVIVERDGRRERGFGGGGGRHDFSWILSGNADGQARKYAREAVRQALVNLDAVDAPAGSMPVVLAPGWAGVLLHEAVGHGLEGDFNRKGTSAYAGRIGETVASETCTVVDDATIQDRRGSLTLDDEGTPGQRTVLIEDGVLRGYMQDKLNARLMKTAPTGNGRRESYACLPMPRMTNTLLLAGETDPGEIISSVGDGVYAVSFGGGQVDITSGRFVFSATEAYRIENGKVTAPVRGMSLVGSGPEVMTRVSMVGNDLALDQGVGTCGKEGQSVPVGVGQPTLKIDEITVGGTV